MTPCVGQREPLTTPDEVSLDDGRLEVILRFLHRDEQFGQPRLDTRLKICAPRSEQEIVAHTIRSDGVLSSSNT